MPLDDPVRDGRRGKGSKLGCPIPICESSARPLGDSEGCLMLLHAITGSNCPAVRNDRSEVSRQAASWACHLPQSTTPASGRLELGSIAHPVENEMPPRVRDSSETKAALHSHFRSELHQSHFQANQIRQNVRRQTGSYHRWSSSFDQCP